MLCVFFFLFEQIDCEHKKTDWNNLLLLFVLLASNDNKFDDGLIPIDCI